MKLETVINRSMMEYPDLYKVCRTDPSSGQLVPRPRDSRIMVLNHLFIVSGNGMQWHPKGFMIDFHRRAHEHRDLPEGYFERSFFSVDVVCKDADKFRSEFAEWTVYEVSVGTQVRFFVDTNGPNDVKERAATYHVEARSLPTNPDFPLFLEMAFEPYRISQHSAMVTATRGEDNAIGIPSISPMADWAEGIVEIARETIAYYENEDRCRTSAYGPEQVMRREFDEYSKLHGEYVARARWGVSVRREAERMAAKNFEAFRKDQIEYCNRAIAKFAS